MSGKMGGKDSKMDSLLLPLPVVVRIPPLTLSYSPSLWW